MAIRIPTPIPYQGSKRLLADRILQNIPDLETGTLYEPFAGSAAVTLAAAKLGKARSFLISDVLRPLMDIWTLIINDPEKLISRYTELWESQLEDPKGTYFRIRDEYNRDHDPVKLLYLIARCVKNAVRFNQQGEFNQSPDNRRLGMRPSKMRREVYDAHHLLKGHTVVKSGDYRDILTNVTPNDVVYMDPPYQGVSSRRDQRYVQGLDLDGFIQTLNELNERRISYLVSFDGASGNKTYGSVLPEELNLTRLSLVAGRSSQATLLGRKAITIESLYLSPSLVERLSAEKADPSGQAKQVQLPL